MIGKNSKPYRVLCRSDFDFWKQLLCLYFAHLVKFLLQIIVLKIDIFPHSLILTYLLISVVVMFRNHQVQSMRQFYEYSHRPWQNKVWPLTLSITGSHETKEARTLPNKLHFLGNKLTATSWKGLSQPEHLVGKNSPWFRPLQGKQPEVPDANKKCCFYYSVSFFPGLINQLFCFPCGAVILFHTLRAVWFKDCL